MKMLKSIVKRLREMCWGIGIIESSLSDIVFTEKSPNITWIKNPYFRERWFADPFILKSDKDKIIVLAEEFSYQRRIGRIAKLIIDRKNMTITDFKIILELDTHLSFPFIIRSEGKIFIMPENCKSGYQSIYEYNFNTDEVKYISTVSLGLFADAIILKCPAGDFLLTTEEPNQNGNILECFKIDRLLKCSKAFETFSFPDNTARNGGASFELEGAFYRPAQICNNRYGEGIEFQRILIGDSHIIGFEPVKRLFPPKGRWELGLHTFNCSPDEKNLFIVDGHGYRFPKIAKFLNILVSLIKN